VGAVAFDGTTFAAALSSGGLEKSAMGRVGDVPLPGCGLFCGESGAVACTGDGEFIALKLLAKEVYTWLENNMSPEQAAKKAITLFDQSVDIGLIILTRNRFASNARNGMAWSHIAENE
jgi:beta-aspartyl-peptidase (threonine type)